MARLVNRVIVATDDARIAQVVDAAGYEARITSSTHETGTDRLAEVARDLRAEIIVNVQGDEPLLDAGAIDAAIEPLIEDATLVMSTTSEPLDSVDLILDPNVVKVVSDAEGFALYFSRSPIPVPRDEVRQAGGLEAALRTNPELTGLFAKHTGLYAYRREFLLRFAKLPRTRLERIESLEQLRALENGFRIKVVPVSHRSRGVDTPEDLASLREYIRTHPDADEISGDN
jgi:3-deoxy-manno-octulosonate cytidylyltransferase (CMP-KDO synthetase)